jgi:hypothetical protein
MSPVCQFARTRRSLAKVELNAPRASLAAVAWLLGTCDIAGQAPPTPCTHEMALALARRCWRNLPVLAPRMREWAGHGLPAQLQDRLEAVTATSAIRDAWTAEFAKRMNRNNIPYAIIKGVACGVLAYVDTQERASFDLDVAVPRPFVRAAQRIAEDCGFQPAQWDQATGTFHYPNYLMRSLTEASHFELGYLVRRQFLCTPADPQFKRLVSQCTRDQISLHVTEQGDVACYIGIDIHHGLALDIAVDEFVATALSKQFNGTPVKVISVAGALFHAVLKIYIEGSAWGEGLHHYTDCIRLLAQADDTVAEQFSVLLAKYNFHGEAYRVLCRIPTDFFVQLPPAFLKIVEESASAGAQRPDMWEKLLDPTSID